MTRSRTDPSRRSEVLARPLRLAGNVTVRLPRLTERWRTRCAAEHHILQYARSAMPGVSCSGENGLTAGSADVASGTTLDLFI
jgi:hypothetical protein